MAEYNDKKLGGVLPTTGGPHIGGSKQRVMLDVHGAEGIRTQIRLNPDGGTTRLRTRAGMPDFLTTVPEVEDEEDKDKDCAAIPVCTEAPYGFKKQDGSIDRFEIADEPYPASSYVDITKTSISLRWNKLKTKSGTGLQHPGNRSWYDSRTAEFRVFKNVISWWCPLTSLLKQNTYNNAHEGGPATEAESIWLGEPTAHVSSQADAVEFSFVSPEQRGTVFKDGKKWHDFGDVMIIAAAVEKRNGSNLIHAVVVDSLHTIFMDETTTASGANYLGFSSSGHRLLTYDTVSGQTTTTGLDEEIEIIEEFNLKWVAPQFSPDGTRLLRMRTSSPLSMIYVNPDWLWYGGNPIVVTTVETGDEEQFGYQSNYTLASEYPLGSSGTPNYTGDWWFYKNVALWFDPNGNPCALQRVDVWSFFSPFPSTEYYRQEWRYGKLVAGNNINDTVTDYEVAHNFASEQLGTDQIESWHMYDFGGASLMPLAHDGFGSFLVGHGVSDINDNLYDRDPSEIVIGATVLLNNFGAIPVKLLTTNADGTPVYIPLPDAKVPSFYFLNPSDYSGLPYEFSNELAYPNHPQIMARMRFSLAVNPDKTKFIAGVTTIESVRIENGTLPDEFGTPVPYTATWYIRPLAKCFAGRLYSDAGAIEETDVSSFWTGDYQFLTSPVFFRRKKL